MTELKRVKLLLVESDEDFRRSVSERLRSGRLKVFEAPDEEAAERIAMTKDPDVALLGLGGLKHRGLAILRSLKARRPTVEVILLRPSEDPYLSMSIEAMKMGAYAEALVPFDLESLFDLIHEAAAKKRLKG